MHLERRTPVARGLIAELHASPCTRHALLLISRVTFQFRELGSTHSKSSAAAGDKMRCGTFGAPDQEATSASGRLRRGAAEDGSAACLRATPENQGTSPLSLRYLFNESALILRCANPSSRSCCRVAARPFFILQVTAAQGKSARSCLFPLCFFFSSPLYCYLG